MFFLAIPYFLIVVHLFPSNQTAITIYSIALLFSVAFILIIKNSSNEISSQKMVFFLLYTCLICSVILLNLFGGNYSFRDISYNGNAVVTLVYIFLIYILFERIPLKDLDVKKVLYCIVALGTVSCIFNLLINFKDILNVSSLQNSYQAEFCSFFLGRNQFGSFLYLCLMAYIILVVCFNQRFNMIIFSLLLLNLFLTFSRAANLGAIIFLFISAFCMKSKKRIWLYLFIILVFMILFCDTSFLNFANRLLIRPDAVSAGLESSSLERNTIS